MKINNNLYSSFLGQQRNLFVFQIVLSIFLVSCSQKMGKEISHPKTESQKLLKSNVKIWKDGTYIDIDTDIAPLPVQGKDEFYRDMFLDFRYPAEAREKSIQGTVIFEVEISKSGSVESIRKIQSLSRECDAEAEEAIRRGCKNGFVPYEYNGNVVRVKFRIPIKFNLE